MIETQIIPGPHPVTVVFHDVETEQARGQAIGLVNWGILTGAVCLPVVRIDVYRGGVITESACHHQARLYWGERQRPALRWRGQEWHDDIVPLSAPSVGGSRWVGEIPRKGAN